jgi:hypothetical protein
MEPELEHYWWEQKPDGTFHVDVRRLLFSIKLTELCIVEILHTCDNKYPEKVPKDVLIERWQAQVLNLRKLPKMLVVRASYYQWFNERGSKRDTFPIRWQAAWDETKYYFECDIEHAWDHVSIEKQTKRTA